MVDLAQVSLLIAGLNALAAATSLAFGWYSWRRGDHPMSDRFALLMFADGTWALWYLFALASPTDGLARFWMPFAELSAALAAVFWFLFVVAYTGNDDRLPGVATPLLIGHAFVYAVLYALNPAGLMHSPLEVARFGVLRVPYEAVGPGQALEVLFVYALLLTSMVLLGRFFLESRNLYQKQAGIILAVTSVIILANVAHLSGLGPYPRLDLTTVFFVVQAVGVGIALYRYDFLEVTPLAASTLLEEMADPVFVVDADGRIVDHNDAATRHVDAAGDRPTLSSVDISGFDRIIGTPDGGTADSTELTTTRKASDHTTAVTYDVRTTPLRDQYDEVQGQVVVLRDITDRKAREQALENQNERLEEFAGIVSHDLRNPLSVIDGRLELAMETGEFDHLEGARDSVDRMERLIDDLLALAREGQAIEETEQVDLARLSSAAWDQVDTDSATLSVTTDLTVAADRSRLQQALENLFRNALEHGGSNVTVGDCEGGFFVADDGPGIPAENRETVFELGYTTGEGGTGLGLAIVRRIVDAHGWSISVVESEDAGARFEITDLYSLAE